MYDFNLVLLLLQQMCVFLVIAWLMSKTPLFIPLMQVTVRLPHKFLCYIVFSIFCIMGTWFGLHIDDSIANTRAIGAVMGGLLGGPVVGGLVGLTGGLHRYSMGGMTALSCMISTIVEGLLGGLVHSILIRRGPATSFCVTERHFCLALTSRQWPWPPRMWCAILPVPASYFSTSANWTHCTVASIEKAIP